MSLPKGLHRCPGRCGRPVRRPACTRCLARLPAELREALLEHRYPRALEEARDWLLEHPAPHDPDHAIAGECEHCYEPLLWLTTGTGARMPVNAEPDPAHGNVVRTGNVAGVLNPQKAAAARRGGTKLWLHHVVTCRYPDRWHEKPAPKTRKAARR